MRPPRRSDALVRHERTAERTDEARRGQHEEQRLAPARQGSVADRAPRHATDDSARVREPRREASPSRATARTVRGGRARGTRAARTGRVTTRQPQTVSRARFRSCSASQRRVMTSQLLGGAPIARGERERHGSDHRDPGGDDQAPAPARHPGEPRQHRRGDQPADRDARLPDAERETVAIAREGEEHEPPARRRRSRPRHPGDEQEDGESGERRGGGDSHECCGDERPETSGHAARRSGRLRRRRRTRRRSFRSRSSTP